MKIKKTLNDGTTTEIEFDKTELVSLINTCISNPQVINLLNTINLVLPILTKKNPTGSSGSCFGFGSFPFNVGAPTPDERIENMKKNFPGGMDNPFDKFVKEKKDDDDLK